MQNDEVMAAIEAMLNEVMAAIETRLAIWTLFVH